MTDKVNETVVDEAPDMPKPLPFTPFLRNRIAGDIHPYSARLAERSDLWEGVYNLQGSKNPEDAPDGYDPRQTEHVVRVRAQMAEEETNQVKARMDSLESLVLETQRQNAAALQTISNLTAQIEALTGGVMEPAAPMAMAAMVEDAGTEAATKATAKKTTAKKPAAPKEEQANTEVISQDTESGTDVDSVASGDAISNLLKNIDSVAE